MLQYLLKSLFKGSLELKFIHINPCFRIHSTSRSSLIHFGSILKRHNLGQFPELDHAISIPFHLGLYDSIKDGISVIQLKLGFGFEIDGKNLFEINDSDVRWHQSGEVLFLDLKGRLRQSRF